MQGFDGVLVVELSILALAFLVLGVRGLVEFKGKGFPSVAISMWSLSLSALVSLAIARIGGVAVADNGWAQLVLGASWFIGAIGAIISFYLRQARLAEEAAACESCPKCGPLGGP